MRLRRDRTSSSRDHPMLQTMKLGDVARDRDNVVVAAVVVVVRETKQKRCESQLHQGTFSLPLTNWIAMAPKPPDPA